MGGQEQTQMIHVESITQRERIVCRWLPSVHASLLDSPGLGTDMTVNPLCKMFVDILIYKGRITHVICEHFASGKCKNPKKPQGSSDACYIGRNE